MSRLRGPSGSALTTGTTHRYAVVETPSDVDPAAAARGPVTTPARNGTGMRRRVLGVGGALVAGVAVAAVLAGSLSDAMTSRAAAQEVLAENEKIRAQVEAGRAEVDFARTAGYLAFAARSFGWGHPDERAFALELDAPPPPRIQPLGADPVVTAPPDTLGQVLGLLFDR